MPSEADFEVRITVASTAHYTEPFPAPDKLTCLIRVENDFIGSNVTVTPQHSGDGGRTWLDKAAIINAVTFGTAVVTPIFGYDDGATPSLPLMRLKISTAARTPNVRFFLGKRGYGPICGVPESRLVFAGMVPSGAVYSELFDIADDAYWIAFHANLVPVIGSGTLAAQLEHSNDGMTFTNFQGSAEINSVPSGSPSESSFFGSAPVNGKIAMRRGRVRLVCNTSGDVIRAKLWATIRRKLRR